MRVLVLSSQYPRAENPTSGIFVREQVAALRRKGIDARVLRGAEAWLGPSRPLSSLDAVRRFVCATPSVTWREEEGAVHAEFPSIVLGRLGDGVRSSSYALGLRRVIAAARREFPFELIHAHTALLDGAAAVGIKRQLGIPVVLTEHTGPFSVITRTRSMRRRVRQALVAADRVLAVSGSLSRMIHQIFPDLERSIDVIPNGVDEQAFRPRSGLRRVDGRLKIMWIGYLGALKRPLLALAAFAAVANHLPALTLQMIGEGPLEAELYRTVEQLNLGARVQLSGYRNRADLAHCLAESDLLLVTSAVETFGLVVIEALSSGVPVLSTRCGGPEEILMEPWLGRLSDDNKEALSQALLEIVQTLPSFVPERLRAYAVERFGMGGIVARLICVYQSVLDATRAATR